jgi:hypothetical protein
MVMLSAKEDTVSAEKLLLFVLASFYITIEDLDVAAIARALHIVGGSPFVNN